MTSEIKRQISDPVDLSENYNSIRRRSINSPPPSLPLSSNKIGNGYGPYISSYKHHRFLSTNGKQSSMSTLVEGDV